VSADSNHLMMRLRLGVFCVASVARQVLPRDFGRCAVDAADAAQIACYAAIASPMMRTRRPSPAFYFEVGAGTCQGFTNL